MKIKNATALVTGANRGIGRAIVKALLDSGVNKVYACARDTDKLKEVVALDIKRVIALKLDVVDQSLINAVVQAAPDVNILFNNAGVLEFGGILEVSHEKIVRQFNTNFYGKLNMARAFAPESSNALTIARPIPRFAPVTRAVAFLIFMITSYVGSEFFHCCHAHDSVVTSRSITLNAKM